MITKQAVVMTAGTILGMALAALMLALIAMLTQPEEARASDKIVDAPITPLIEADGQGPPIVTPGKEYVVFYEKDLNMKAVAERGDDYYMAIGDEGVMVVAVAMTREEHKKAHELGIPHSHPVDQPGKLLVDHFKMEVR